MYPRWLESRLAEDLKKPLVHILFGARQTGKTTLLDRLVPNPSLRCNLVDPEERTRLLAAPFDSVQVLFDRSPRRWRFVLCGSSARNLRRQGTNLLPGRSLLHRLFPLVLAERPAPGEAKLPAVLPMPGAGSRTFYYRGTRAPAAGTPCQGLAVRGGTMRRVHFVPVAAALLLLIACSAPPKEAGVAGAGPLINEAIAEAVKTNRSGGALPLS